MPVSNCPQHRDRPAPAVPAAIQSVGPWFRTQPVAASRKRRELVALQNGNSEKTGGTLLPFYNCTITLSTVVGKVSLNSRLPPPDANRSTGILPRRSARGSRAANLPPETGCPRSATFPVG